MTPRRTILISGAGIAGCAAAIALAKAGHRVQVIERAAAWHFQSSGIFVYANGLLALDRLGIMEDALAAGFAVPDGRNAYYDADGTFLTDVHYPSLEDGRIPPILGIKRAALQRCLSTRMQALGVSVQLDSRIEDLGQDETAVTVRLASGAVITADLLVVAEGLRATSRTLAGWTVAPRYSGFGVWRAVHDRPDSLREKVMMMGAGLRLGIMPISEDKLYTFGTVPMSREDRIAPQTAPRQMAQTFAAMAAPARAFLDDLGPHSETFYTAVEEIVLPLPWHKGRVVLIGDAAHAATPFMGQGGAMAMEDAVVLAEALEDADDLETALDHFGTRRAPICRFVQDVSRAVGEAGALETPHDVAARNADLIANGQAKVDGFYAKLTALRDAPVAHFA